ncbi:uncharacterized protein VTP21DRAFT_4156 [Calcarisporiella thermophila]|uniref:uncharacterized protein n=1 Tax=Calcarisporiella thermophila TaxID=911321 RepID=UPI003742D67D
MASAERQSTLFRHSFWPRSAHNPHDFSTGLQALHTRLDQLYGEIAVIANYFLAYANAEESHSTRLLSIHTNPTPISSSAAILATLSPTPVRKFAKNPSEETTVQRGFDLIRKELEQEAQERQKLAKELADRVAKPLERFTEEYRRKVRVGRERVELKVKIFAKILRDVTKTKSQYETKCRSLEEARELKATDLNISSAPSSLNKQEGIKIDSWAITRMQSELPAHDKKFPLLGTYRGVHTGEDIVKWLCTNHPSCKLPADAEKFGQTLVQQGHLRRVGQIGNSFVGSDEAFYLWREKSEGGVGAGMGKALANIWAGAENITNAASSNSSIALTGGMGLEDHVKKLESEVAHADTAYLSAVRKADLARQEVEQLLFEHFDEMENLEMDRVDAIRLAYNCLAEVIANSAPNVKEIGERLGVIHETLKPLQDVRYSVDRCRTGTYTPQPIIYENFYHGKAQDQIFGVPIEELSREEKNDVPHLVATCLKLIEDGSAELPVEDKLNIWTHDPPLSDIFPLRNAVNDPANFSVDTLRNQALPLVAALLRTYFAELPECLFTTELYDALHTLYLTGDAQNGGVRMKSVANLLATLPTTSFTTLEKFLARLNALYIESQDRNNSGTVSKGEDWASNVAKLWAPALLRTHTEGPRSFDNRHPPRVIHDLILCHDEIFTEETRKALYKNSMRLPLQTKPATIEDEVKKRNSSEQGRATPEKHENRQGEVLFTLSPVEGSGKGWPRDEKDNEKDKKENDVIIEREIGKSQAEEKSGERNRSVESTSNQEKREELAVNHKAHANEENNSDDDDIDPFFKD